jgi:hypothetical protein
MELSRESIEAVVNGIRIVESGMMDSSKKSSGSLTVELPSGETNAEASGEMR